jgi:hypothetical protein
MALCCIFHTSSFLLFTAYALDFCPRGGSLIGLLAFKCVWGILQYYTPFFTPTCIHPFLLSSFSPFDPFLTNQVSFAHDGDDGFVPPTPVPGHLVQEAREPWGSEAIKLQSKAPTTGDDGEGGGGGRNNLGTGAAAVVVS